MWSIGCIFAELLQGGKPLFPGQGEIDQLGRIFELLGTPNEENWPDAIQLPTYFQFTQADPKPFETVFSNVPEETLDLLKKILALNPTQRISASEVRVLVKDCTRALQALGHPYFTSQPFPCAPEELPLHAF